MKKRSKFQNEKENYKDNCCVVLRALGAPSTKTEIERLRERESERAREQERESEKHSFLLISSLNCVLSTEAKKETYIFTHEPEPTQGDQGVVKNKELLMKDKKQVQD